MTQDEKNTLYENAPIKRVFDDVEYHRLCDIPPDMLFAMPKQVIVDFFSTRKWHRAESDRLWGESMLDTTYLDGRTFREVSDELNRSGTQP